MPTTHFASELATQTGAATTRRIRERFVRKRSMLVKHALVRAELTEVEKKRSGGALHCATNSQLVPLCKDSSPSTGHSMSFRNNWKDCDAFGADTAGHQKEEKLNTADNTTHGAHKAIVGSNEKTGHNYTESP